MRQFLMLFLCGCTAVAGSASCQSTVPSGGLPFIGSTAYSTVRQHPFSFTVNEASLARADETVAGIYSERRFLLPDDQLYSFAGVLHTSSGNIGLHVNRAGAGVFIQQTFRIAYAKKLSDKIDLGIQFSNTAIKIQGYKNASLPTTGAAVLLHISDKVNAGAAITGFSFLRNRKNVNGVPSATCSFGIGYDASRQLFACLQIIKQEGMPVNVMGNFRYAFANNFSAGIGFLSETSSVNSSAGIQWKKVRMEMSVTTHPQLGVSPALAIIFYFKNSTL